MVSPEQKYTVLGIGELLWDMLPGGRKMGGAVANFIYFAQALGAQGTLITRVGEDEPGREIFERIKEIGLDTEYIQTDPEHPTGTVDVELDGKGIPKYTIHENTAWDYIEPLGALLEQAAQADAICFGTLCQRSPASREAIRKVVECGSEDALKVCDINLRQEFYNEEIINWSCVNADVVKLNDDEVHIIGRIFNVFGDQSGIAEGIMDMFGLSMVALTRGEKGSMLFTPEGVSEHPGYPAEVKDSVGAGDSFGAAVTVGLLTGLDIDEIHDRANRIAAFVCSHDGATPDISSIT